MLRRVAGEIEWLEFELFQEVPQLRHGLLLRHGGVSETPYSSLNLSHGVGDNRCDVEANLERVQRLFSFDQLCSAKQVHGANLVEVGRNGFTQSPEADGLYTDCPHIGLLIQYADCQAALFYDPIQRAIACVHAGWRGSVDNIYGRTIERFKERYGSRPAELLVGIGPSLGPLRAEFVHYRRELPASFWEFQTGANHFDFWEISRQQLLMAGVLPGHIEIAGICTYSHPENHFSARRDRVTGRHGMVAGLL